METKIYTTKLVTTTIELTGEDILAFLRLKHQEIFQVGRQTTVRFLVPTGGDYSGIALDIDKDNPIYATVTVEYREKS